ncbi:MAG: glycosyltransferase family 39 protein [Bryobacteraceae bacterium]|jgi:hypothetical protein
MNAGWWCAKAGTDAWLPALLAASVARLWLMPLPSSFWIDEMATVFVVKRGASDPSLAAAPQVAQSIYYWLPRGAQALFGSSEVAYRLASVAAMAAALYLVARLAARLIHPGARWFAVFAALALSGFDYQAADARPYALGACVAAAGVFTLVRWLDTARWRDGLLFALFAALLWRVHLVYWPFYLVFAAYALARLLRRETRAGWAQVGAVFGLAGAALVPVLVDAVALFREAQAHVIAAPPSLRVLEHALRWNLVLICGAGAWFLGRFRGRTPSAGARADAGGSRGREKSGLVLIAAWWLCQPLCLFAFSWLTGNSVFVPRYLSVMLPGVALAATAVTAWFLPAASLNRLAAALGVGGLLFLGQWGRLWPAHEHSDWRGAARKVNSLALGPDTPVICPSPFIEAQPPVWRPDYRLPGFLYAHLSVYPISGTAVLFPFEPSPGAERYAASLVSGPLAASRRFILYGWDGSTAVGFWRNWFASRPELTGWRQTRFPFGDVDVVTFER